VVKGGEELGYVESYNTGVTLFGLSSADDMRKVNAVMPSSFCHDTFTDWVTYPEPSELLITTV